MGDQSDFMKLARESLEKMKQEQISQSETSDQNLVRISPQDAAPDKKYARVTVALSLNLRRRFFVICEKQEKRPSSVAAKLIEDYVEKNELPEE